MTNTFLPAVKDGAHIGLLGGSFNPPHIGHQLLALSFLALEPIDELWVLPCADHAFKGPLFDFAHRFAMCQLAFERIVHVRVLDLENHLPAPNYTVQTIEHILHQLPNIHLYLGIGSDLINSFERWHEAQRVAALARIVIFERDSYPITSLPPVLTASHQHRGHPLPDVNSTNLRSRGMNDPLAYIDRAVVRYIREHKLFSHGA